MIQMHTNPQNPNSTKNMKFVGVPFQVFGFDILIDKNLKAWLLEINDHPSLNAYVCKTEMGCTHKNCPISSVDEHVKKQVLTDSLKLMLKARKQGIDNIDDRFRNMTRIFPCEDEGAADIFENVKDLRLFFLTLTKGKPELSGYEFEQKFAKSQYITQKCSLKRYDLTIIF